MNAGVPITDPGCVSPDGPDAPPATPRPGVGQVVQRDDPGVLQPAGYSGLPEEPGDLGRPDRAVRADRFERHVPPDHRVTGDPDRPEPSGPVQPERLVPAP